MKRDDRSPQHYIDAIEDPDQQALFLVIRKLILAAHKGEEIIEYGMLGYPGLANLAAQKNYVSLYVLPEALKEHKQAHPDSNCGKSCLRFTKNTQVDEPAITQLLERVKELR